MSGIQQILLGAGATAAPVAIPPNAIAGLKLWYDGSVAPTKTGTAAAFRSASNEYLSHASDSNVQTGDVSFTFAGWVLFATLSTSQQIVSKDASTGREYYIHYDLGTNRLRGSVFRGGTDRLAIWGTPPVANTWYFIVFWHDASTDTVNISVNNGATVSAGTTGALDAPTTTEFRLGRRVYTANEEPLNGRLQNWGFWKRVLTGTERTFLYNSGAGRQYAALSASDKTTMISWWALNEPSGTRVDSHGTTQLTNNGNVQAAAGIVAEAGTCANNDPVGIWADQSGLGNNATSKFKPIYITADPLLGNKAVLRFVRARLDSPANNALKPYTRAIVMYLQAVGVGQAIISGSAGFVGHQVGMDAANNWRASVNGTPLGTSTTTIGLNVPVILTWTYSSVGAFVYRKNDIVDGSGTNNIVPAAGTYCIGTDSVDANPATITLAEMCEWDSVITASDMTGLVNYFKQKYSI